MQERSDSSVDFSDIVANVTIMGLVVVDHRFNVVMWNRFMELNSRVPAEDVLGKNLFDVFPELNRNWLEKKIKSCLILKMASYSSWRQRPYLFRFNAPPTYSGTAEFMYQDASIFPVLGPHGSVKGTCISILDTSELAEATRLLEQTMETAIDLEESNRRDALTGMYNRKFFDEQITQEAVSARRYTWPLVLAVIDIDHFKVVNDTHGHQGGDAVLRALAVRLHAMIRSSDSLCRYGGEEFALILPHIDTKQARIFTERLRKAIEAMRVDVGGGMMVSVTISIGIASLQPGMTPGQLIARADESLYAAKHQGRNCVACFGEPDPVAAA